MKKYINEKYIYAILFCVILAGSVCIFLFQRGLFIDLTGEIGKMLSLHNLYCNEGIYLLDDDYIVSVQKQTSTDYEYEQLKAFHDFLENEDKTLLYVNAPTKYLDDTEVSDKTGAFTYCNRNADVLLERLREANIKTLDLRACIQDDQKDIRAMFYRTDHHWTVESGLWAAEKIAASLNEQCDCGIDLSVYEKDNYNMTKFENCWLGEQGKKMGQTFVGLDDFTVVTPKESPVFTFHTPQGDVEYDFRGFLYDGIFNSYKDLSVYDCHSWHYSYQLQNVSNPLAKTKKVLVLGDSYLNVVECFLAMGLSDVDYLNLRAENVDLKKYILESDYDIIVVCYAEFMIGAHDDINNSNYKMFNFF